MNYISINSSKVYCKYKNTQDGNVWRCVLIVAKCIVNLKILIFIFFNNNVLIVAKCIVNYSQILCKNLFLSVLIVAKCIVNSAFANFSIVLIVVLIVAKCIVNKENNDDTKDNEQSINSSKVYCKYFTWALVKLKVEGINSSKVYCKYYF